MSVGAVPHEGGRRLALGFTGVAGPERPSSSGVGAKAELYSLG